ncbi:MAG: efflux RND transporter periplasmic adaptor subunit [Planctomycetales bacterium]|nr:efflux RND transporter periplasmic adaptor subunit [Planctomycetales bacterium]
MPLVDLKRTIVVALAVMLLCPTASGQSRSSRLPLTNGYAPDGVLEPWKISNVASTDPGLVEQIHVKLGDRVQVGDVLANIESSAISMQLAIAEAQATSVGRQRSAQAEVELHQRKVQAIQNAREQQFSSQTELDRALADLEISRGRLVSELEEQEIFRLHVARLKQQLKQRTILAPINGIVVELHKQLGEYVSPTTPEVLRIADVSRLRASFFLQLHEVESLSQAPHVLVELHDGLRTVAEVEHISPVADSESGLIEVRVLIDNPQLKILGSRCTLLFDQTPPPQT